MGVGNRKFLFYMNSRRLLIYAIVTGFILMIPLIAMQFTTEVNWTGSDFVVAGTLLFGSALVYELASRNVSSPRTRLVIAFIVLAILAFIWVGAATGFEGIIKRFQ